VTDPSFYGSEFVQPARVDNAIIFLQRQGRRIRELRDGETIAPDLALMAEHLTSAGITEIDYGKIPDPTVFVVMGNGQLAVMAYNREQNINAWSRYITDGTFESLAVVYGSPSDVVYAIVKRTIGGVTKRYIEVFTAEQPEVVFSFVYSDSSVVYSGALTTTITGLSHLEGKTVAVVGSTGNVIGDGALVVSGGQITIPEADTFVRVGLAYRGQVTPMKIDLLMQNGTSQGRRRRISELCIRFRHAIGGSWGNSATTNLAIGTWNAEIPFRDTTDNMNSGVPLFTGDKVLPSEAVNDLVTDFSIFQTQPLPQTILGLFAKMEVTSE
jgi:hypothetical protein